MKARIYVRLARSRRARAGWRVDAAMQPNPRPLTDPQGSPEHTVNFALDVMLPDDIFKPAEWPTIEIELHPETLRQMPDEVIAVSVDPDVGTSEP